MAGSGRRRAKGQRRRRELSGRGRRFSEFKVLAR
jgi:hypothetical protein